MSDPSYIIQYKT